ncbi:MAG: hypothetical protein WD733_10080, partial [Bryobacterales bacterium]
MAAAQHLEGVRRRFEELGLPLADQKNGPTLVLIFANRESLDPYASRDSRDPSLTRGLSLAGGDQTWIAVAWDAPGSPMAALAHEYAHLARPAGSAPLWFREGLAEYLAGLGTAPEAPEALSPHHLQALREQPWSEWGEFVAANRMSAAFARPNFYSQAWLAVHWLAAQGTAPARLEPGPLESLVRDHGGKWAETRLSEHAARLWEGVTLPGRPQQQSAGPDSVGPAESTGAAFAPGSPPSRQTEAWELQFWRAEFHRELGHWDLAQPALELLERDFPKIPEPSEALAAVAIARGRYDLAEEKLRSAVGKGALRPATHFRYSLMLMRP